jgi:hypothetical protein
VITLAKDAIDVDLFTERLSESLQSCGSEVGLLYEEMLPIGGGVRQHRFSAGQSAVKVNHSKDPLPGGAASTLAAIRLSMPTGTAHRSLSSPDG